MKSRSCKGIMLLACLLLQVLSAGNLHAQTLPRTYSGRPDLQGIWKVENNAFFNIEDHVARYGMPAGMGVVEGGPLPYTAAALAQREENFATRAVSDSFNRCFFPGVPRIMYLDFPFQIFQTDEHVAMTFEWNQVHRLVYLEGDTALYEGIESWMGHSRGRWDGDVLVVSVKDFNDRSWLDSAGNFHSASMQLTERYRMLDADTIEYEVTVEDPEVFTRPWVMRMNLHRQTDRDRLLEYQCQAELSELNGDFERDERTWYPAPPQPGIAAFDTSAVLYLPLPQPTGQIRRLPDGTPDISGYFSAMSGGANYGLEKKAGGGGAPPTQGVVIDPPDKLLPYQAWARAEADERYLPHRGYDDPTAHCFVAGVPRSHYVPSPFHILQPDGYVVVLHERMSWRHIDLNRTTHLPDSMRLWMGDSIGHWEGDTLVVESTNFNGKAWHNEAGDVVTHAQNLVEFFTPVSDTEINYRVTVSDPLAYTRPWTIEMTFVRSDDDELLEVACLEDNNDLQHLRDVRDEYRAAQAGEN
jgi:hypothetical protein